MFPSILLIPSSSPTHIFLAIKAMIPLTTISLFSSGFFNRNKIIKQIVVGVHRLIIHHSPQHKKLIPRSFNSLTTLSQCIQGTTIRVPTSRYSFRDRSFIPIPLVDILEFDVVVMDCCFPFTWTTSRVFNLLSFSL